MAQLGMDNDSAGAVLCCESFMGYAHVARLTGQLQKDEDSGPRLGDDMGVGTRDRTRTLPAIRV